MKGFTFDLQRFATTWLLTLNSEGIPTLTEEGMTNSTALSDKSSNERNHDYYFSEVISDGDTVKLGEDITVADTAFYVGQTMTLDLNGKTLEVTGSYVDRIIQFEIATTAKGDLTITDTSDAGNGTLLKNDVTSTNASYVVGSRKTGDKITLERGNLINTSTKGAGIYLGHANTFTMTGGTIKVPSTDTNVAGVRATNVSKITVNISGGTIETGNVGVESMITSAKSTVTISGGSISGTNAPITASNASKVTITGGVFNQADETLGISTAVTIDGETKYCVSVDTIGDEYIPVTIDGTTSYYSTEEKKIAAIENYISVTNDSGTVYYSDATKAGDAIKDFAAQVGEKAYYTTVTAANTALANVEAGTTVTVGIDTYAFTGAAGSLKLDDNKAVSEIGLTKNTVVTVTPSGSETATVTYTGGDGIEDSSTAKVTIDNTTGEVTLPTGVTATGLQTITLDGTTSYYTTQELADAAVTGKTKITIDGTTKYFTTDELAAAATSDCIARIGDDKYYTTLQAAVNAVQDKGTITLLKDATGSGVKVASSKNFTLDFNKHTYTVVDTPVGSTGTETIGFQLLQNSTIIFKDGKIAAGAYGANNNLLRLIQNYANLTLDNMNIDGSGLLVNSAGRKLVAGVDNTIITVSTNNGTLNLTGTTSIEAIDTRYYKQDGKIVATTSGTALAVGYAAQSYPNGAQVNVNTTGAIDGISFGTWGEGGNTFTSGLTVTNGTIKGDITIDDDALTLGALDKITIEGGTFANNAITADAKLLVVDNVLVAEGWNSVSDSFVYVKVPPESGNVGTKLITVGNVTSTDQIKFDSEQQIFAVPTTAKISGLATGYKTVKVAYDANSTTATVSTDDDGIEITENLLAGTVTKISASGNANTVYISGGDKVNSIVGGTKDDTLAGSKANISLTGGEGADIFVAGEKITITDYGVGSDKISVAADAGTPDIKVSGKNLLLTLGGKTVNLLNAADKVVTLTNGEVDSYYSKDGQTSDDGLTVTLPASTKTYTAKAPIKNVDGSKTAGVNITGNALDNVLTGGKGNDKLFGNAGNDTLKASAGTDTLNGGKGDDLFVYSTAGNAVITDYSTSGTNGADKISLDATPTSFKFSGSNLVLTFGDERTLTVNGAKNKALTFAGGDKSTVRTYIDNGAVKEDGKVTLDQNFKGAGQNISKVNDVTQIDASTATVKVNLVGNNLGNTLKGGKGNDTLTGGVTAADEYTGNAGADVFVYNGGTDTITDYKSTDGDTLKLAKNFSIKSATFGKDDVVFTLNAAGNVVTLTGAAKDTITVKDASNKVWTYTDEYTAQSNGVTLQSSATAFDASADAWKNLVTLDGSAASAVKLTGNAKNNVFVGTKGADTFVYSAGSDVITNYDATDKVQVDNFSSITAAKFSGSKTVVTVGKGAITFNNAPKEINLVDSKNNSATLTNAGIVTGDGIQLFNGTKTYAGTADNVDASNVKNAVTLAGGSKAQTFTGAAGRTVYTYSGTDTMTIANYAAGDKISVKGSVTNFEVADNNVTLTVGKGSIVLKDAADKLITLHDDNDKAGKFTARAYLQTGVTADKVAATAVTLAADVGTYAAPQTVRQITYTGGNVTITKFDTTRGKINHGDLKITDVSETALAFGTGNTLTIGDLESDTKVQLTGTVNNKTVNSTVYLGEHVLYNNVSANATTVSVTGGSEFTAGDKVNSVTALGSEKLSIAGNTRNNTLTANDKGDTLDGGAGTDVLIGGNGADIFIHDKITGTTTINGYMSTDSISLGDELSIVGSAYSPSTKNGTLTLTVEGTNDAGKASTSKIVIKSDDFTKADAATYGTIVIDEKQTSFGKNAIYFRDDEVKLLSTYSGKFTATAGGQVDGSDVTKTLTLQGTTGNETLTGGAFKTTLTGGKGDDSLHGGDGADVFTYAKGDGKDVIADFTYNDDKLKVSTGKLISDISVDGNDLKFDMTDGGSVTIEDVQDNFVIKANSKLYWFDGGDLVTAKTNTADMKTILNDKTGNYAVVNLEYGTNLVTAELATYTDATFSATTYKKTTT